jgi:HEAT repeats
MMKHAIRAALTATISVALALGVSAQAKTPPQPGGEKTVEEAYLQESAEAMMVKELSKADDKDSKLVALLYVRRALDGGRRSSELRNSLQFLALEGNQVVIRSAGLGVVTNNFPDIRAKACEYLAEFPSVESKDTLVSVLHNNRSEDPMVLAEAIRALGKIGINDNDEVVKAFATAVSHFSDVGISEDRLAVYTLFAFLDLAEKNRGIKDMGTVTNTIMNFTKGSYIGSVKKLALQTLDKLSQYSTKSASK